jgi:Domain of unknown function (DUF3850)
VGRIHHLKSWPDFFQPIKLGRRTHELRRNDRHFIVGDVLVLHEFDPKANCYTGEQCQVEITSMTSFAQPCAVSGEALNPDFCILSIHLMNPEIKGLEPSANLEHPRAACFL